ncbi:hypothetical protein YC2023_108499 [Brassica napus]
MKIQAKRYFRTAMVGSGQVLSDLDMTVELVRKGEKLTLTCFGARGGGYRQRAACKISGNGYLCSFSGLNHPTALFNCLLGLISPFLYGKQKKRTREELRERKVRLRENFRYLAGLIKSESRTIVCGVIPTV